MCEVLVMTCLKRANRHQRSGRFINVYIGVVEDEEKEEVLKRCSLWGYNVEVFVIC